MVNSTATNQKILSLYKMMQSGMLILKPFFQRNLVWNDKNKEDFIDTILKGYPFPEVYFADGEIDIETMEKKIWVVDGQQRLQTIYDYIKGDENLKLKKVKRYSELSDDEKRLLLDYIVVIRDLGKLSEDEIKEIFKRINSTKYVLDSIEINNALYQGEYISTAKEILNMKMLDRFDVFSDSDISKMEDLEFIILIMTTLEIGGYFNRDKEVEEFIKKYDNEYPGKEKIKDIVKRTLDIISNLDLNPDTIWYKKSALFTLVIELCKVNIYDRIENGDLKYEDLKNLLVNFEESILENKNKSKDTNQYANFYNYIYQGTASRTGRVRRGEILRNELLKIL